MSFMEPAAHAAVTDGLRLVPPFEFMISPPVPPGTLAILSEAGEQAPPHARKCAAKHAVTARKCREYRSTGAWRYTQAMRAEKRSVFARRPTPDIANHHLP